MRIAWIHSLGELRSAGNTGPSSVTWLAASASPGPATTMACRADDQTFRSTVSFPA